MGCVRAWCSRPPAAPSVVPAALFEGHIQAGFFRLIAPLSSWKMFLSASIGFVKHVVFVLAARGPFPVCVTPAAVLGPLPPCLLPPTSLHPLLVPRFTILGPLSAE